jgi:hypothetical protein
MRRPRLTTDTPPTTSVWSDIATQLERLAALLVALDTTRGTSTRPRQTRTVGVTTERATSNRLTCHDDEDNYPDHFGQL